MAGESRTRWSFGAGDAALVGAVVTISVLNSLIKGANGLVGDAPPPVLAAVSGAVGLLLMWRRCQPGLVGLAVMVGFVAAFTPASLAVAMYTIGTAYRKARPLILYTAAACTAVFVSLLTSRPAGNLRESLYTLALVLGMLAVGQTVAFRRDLTLEAQERAQALEREQHLLTERAQVGERARIAREMHDVVAHRITNIVLTANALKVSPAGQSMAEVAQAGDQIRSEGHQALEELRDILGVLTPGRDGLRAPRTPQPDASQLGRLVESAASRGQDVRLKVNGHPEALPDAVQRAIYRIAQECLTNAAKHAPGAVVTLTVECRLDGVHMSIANGPPIQPAAAPPGGGYGLIGLRERMALLGGTLTAGPHDAGFKVEACIPVDT